MAAHFAHQEVNKSWGYKCDNCGKVYTLSHVLSRHKWKCKGLREILCQICNAKFYRMDHLKKHMFRHGAVEQWFPNAGSRTTGTSNSWPSLDSSAIEKSEPRNNKNKREKVTS
ncbi:unnamed protein product [Lymnaea stagnalis]|uniref:C2H2-type domain-containing protein n=1 Tax=Lymnaea stagnalis TaxID=6523 RepID=A0AAV2IHA7_LYMST